ncbi:MAG: FkbM family methyltransferase [Rhodospirillaceae bacterium]
MGIGDDIMVTAIVRSMQARDPRTVAVLGKDGAPRWNDIAWAGNPRILRRGRDLAGAQTLQNHGGRRPWIAGKSRERFAFNPWRPEPGEWFLSAAESAWALQALPSATVLIHCTPGRMNKTVNMDWGRDRWAELARRLARAGVPVVELRTPGQAPVAERSIEAPDFRHAVAAVARARLFVTPEGGLHHAAAATSTRAVVLFGGFAPPATFGYAGHINIAAREACGIRTPCAHCRRAWADLDPARVAHLTEEALQQTDMTGLNAPPAEAADDGRTAAEGLIEFRGLWLPAHERHLLGWIDTRMRKHPEEIVDGRPTYQRHKLLAAMRHVARPAFAVDVGAHCGLWSMQLAAMFRGLVCAFEPVAVHRAAFMRNVRPGQWDAMGEAMVSHGGDGRCVVYLHPFALGASPGWCAIHTTPGSSGDSWPIDGDQVEIRPLDLYGLAELDLLKIDCEGYELNVLKGAEQTVARCKPVIVVEQKPGKGQQHGLGERDSVAWLEARGYRTADVLSGDYIMVPASPAARASQDVSAEARRA